MKKMLVVVDMVNGFINEGALADKQINKITPNIVSLIEQAKREGKLIVAFKDCHCVDDEEFKTFPPHCIKGSSESELIPELKKYEKDMILIEKNTTNGFITEQFMDLIKEQDFDNVLVVGCCTDICVSGFVNSYLDYIEENNLDTEICVDASSCYTFDGEGHNAILMHDRAIEEMKKNGAVIVNMFLNKKMKKH